MIKIYTYKTPNGYKPLLLLEELGIEYEMITVPLDGTQKEDWFLKICPNGKIPAIVDESNELSLFESGAILQYLAEEYEGEGFYPKDTINRAKVNEWLMFQMGGVGPMFGQMNHFLKMAKEDVPYGKKRYYDESHRLCQVVEEELSKNSYLAGEFYSIADMATYPWFKALKFLYPGFLDTYSNTNNWMKSIEQRKATQRAYAVEFKE
ncbi:MAG: glutathione S-transferase family protein [Candidatus Nanoarchaeia archaeon]